jgi:hypothetical protein
LALVGVRGVVVYKFVWHWEGYPKAEF